MLHVVQISRHCLIETPPEALWRTLSAFDQLSRWASNVDHAALTTPQKDGIGATRRVQRGRLTLHETITEWVPTEKLTYSIVGLPAIAGAISNSWQLERIAQGTRVTITSRLEPGSGIVGRIVATILARLMAKSSSQLLRTLAAAHASTEGALAAQV